MSVEAKVLTVMPAFQGWANGGLSRNFASAQKRCRIAAVDFVRRNILGHDATGGHDRALTNLDTCGHESSSPYPRSVAYINRVDQEPECRIGPVVIARAEIRTLRNTHMVAQSYRGDVIDPAVFSNPAVVAHSEEPWILYSHPGLDHHTSTNTRSKKPKYDSAEGSKRQERGSE